MANYVLSKKAVDDLSGIWNHTSKAWSEAQANKYSQRKTLNVKPLLSEIKTAVTAVWQFTI